MFPRGKIRISEENFLIMQPILVCSRFFGLCPLRYISCGRFYTLQWSWGVAIYSFVLPGIFASITLYSLSDEIDDKVKSQENKKRQFLTICDILTITLIVLFCILTTPGKLKSFWKICQYFNEIEDILIIKNYKRYRATSIAFIATILIIYSIFYITDFLSWYMNYDKIDESFILLKGYLPFYFLKFIMLNQILFFCHMIYFIKIRIHCLSASLNKIIPKRIFDVTKFHNGEITVLPPKLTYNMEINNTALRVQELTKAYKKLSDIVHIINGTVEFAIVVIMFCLVLHLVVSPYFLVSELEKTKDANMGFVALQIMWIIAHFGKFIIIIETSHQCLSEKENLCMLVRKIHAQETVEQTKKALFILIMQLTNCKIHLNVVGLFKLKRSLLSGFVASITTYLVVLLQLK